MNKSCGDVVVVGGGVIGLSVAYALAREGVSVALIDKREFGREASWAGAGLIPPCSDRLPSSALDLFRFQSASLYPVWSERLLADTGIDNGFRQTGGVDVAWTDKEDQSLSETAAKLRNCGIEFNRLSRDAGLAIEPALNPELRAVFYLPGRSQIRNPWHLTALQAALTLRGGRLYPNEAVVGFDEKNGKITAVRTEQECVSCDTVIITAGAWSEGVLGRIGVRVLTPPVKGQMILFKTARHMLRRIVEHGKKYLVPREDGRILMGATEEHSGFDTSTTTNGLHGLFDEAIRLVPALAHATIERTWAGLRPGSFDGRPYIGRVPSYSNLLVATGHGRAGLQLAPATAEGITDMIMERRGRIDLNPFRIDREWEPPAEETFRS